MDFKRRNRASAATVLLPLVTVLGFILFLAPVPADVGMGSFLELKRASAPVCKNVLVFTSQRHGSNTLMEGINNCNVEKEHKYSRTFEFPEYSLDRIRNLNLNTYESFYEYYKTIPKYQYKIMSNIFYQMYYHVDNFVTHLMSEEEPFTYVLLKRNNTVEVFYSHADHLRQTRSRGIPEPDARMEIGDLVVQGKKRESFQIMKWSEKDYETYKNYFHHFYDDVRAFMRQKRLPLDELFYEDVIINPPISEDGKEIFLPASNCILKLCHRGGAVFNNERSTTS